MNYWEGTMDWPLNKDWKCEFCGERLLIWGIVHATCRCSKCHIHYRMRNEDDNVVDTPICNIKLEYAQAYKNIFNETRKPIDEVTDAEWDEVGVKTKGDK